MRKRSCSALRAIARGSAAIATAFASLGAPPGHAGPELIRVGAGPACDFATLQEAIDSVPTNSSDMTIQIANDQSYADQALTIEDRSIDIFGGYVDCEGTDDVTRTVIGGMAGAGPVLRVSETLGQRYVFLHRMELTGGDGGLAVEGAVFVYLSNLRIHGNAATLGGGVYVDGGDSGLAVLDIDLSTRIGADGPNTAVDGAGVYCRNGGVRLRRATVSHNVASGNGGGFYLDGCTLDSIGVQPADDGNHIDYNEAAAGGAIYATNDSDIGLGFESGRTDFLGNQAATNGGAFHLTGAGTVASLRASRLEANVAGQRGGVVYTADSTFIMERGHTEPALCPQFPCSALISNRAGIEGTVAFARADGRVDIRETVVTQGDVPSAGPVCVVNGSGSFLLLNNVLMYGMSGEGVRLDDGGNAQVLLSTFAGNDFSADFHLGSNVPSLFVGSSIIWDAPAALVAAEGAASLNGACNHVHDPNFPGETGDPGFVDPASDNYRLRASSLNVDACELEGSSLGVDGLFPLIIDVAGTFRPVDLAPMNGPGPYDRGAFELTDAIFADGFD